MLYEQGGLAVDPPTVVLVTRARSTWLELAEGLTRETRLDLVWADSGQKALDLLHASKADLVIADEYLADMRGLALVRQVVLTNPMIDCAVVDGRDEGEFHQAAEGLGLLGRLPVPPGAQDGAELMFRWKRITGRPA